MSKTPPIPTRFEQDEHEAINQLKLQSGLAASEIIRRSVRLFWQEAQERGIGTLLIETSIPLDTHGFQRINSLRAAEEPTGEYGTKPRRPKKPEPKRATGT